MARRLPGIDAVATLDFPWFNRRPHEPVWRRYGRLLTAGWRIRHGLRTTPLNPSDPVRPLGPFDAALILRDDDWWSAWLAQLAGIPVRIGHDHPRLRPYLTQILPAAARPVHTAAANIALVLAATEGDRVGVALDDRPRAAGEQLTPQHHPLIFQITDDDHRAAEALLAGIPVADTGLDREQASGSNRTTPRLGHAIDVRAAVAIHPGAGAPVKLWRTSAWREVIRAVMQATETVMVTGAAGEADLTRAVAELAALEGRAVLDLGGCTDVGTLAAVFARCRLVMGPDSGPLHLAVAVGTPTVHLFGPADVARFGPWGPAERHRVVVSTLPCAPCGRLDWAEVSDHPCVRVISVAEVVGAVRAVGVI